MGSGNVPVYIDASADVAFTLRVIRASKLFEYGTICASEQAIVVKRVFKIAGLDGCVLVD